LNFCVIGLYCLVSRRDGTAMGGSDLSKKIDYVSQKGILEFQHAETTKTITVDINKNAQVSDCSPYD